ncbi:MAG: 8-amino-7-oxononanoate synthase [Actinomycetota bacterium]|nr:8-amino-7-oxononanoate synthase [Actinomycetota bacterium]
MNWSEWVAEANGSVRADGRWRSVRDLDAFGITGNLDGRAVVSFASNDYLGLTAHPKVIEGAREALERWGAGSGSARLIVGSRPVHSQLERELARWKNAEAVLLFPTGFAANLGVLTAFGGPDVTIFSDERNHASIVDGCRMARARVVVFDHLDYDGLGRGLEKTARAIVVTDTVFSMDGDLADVERLAWLCRRHDALLVLDEAHAVLGPHPDLSGVTSLRVGTLSKFLGAMGGFVSGERDQVDLLVNRARPFIFTTALSPADAGAALAALMVLRSDEGRALRARLETLVRRVAPGHKSPIVPLLIGDERAAEKASAALLDRGLLVPAIRPPSVAPGTSRLRVTLSSAHTDAQVDALLAGIEEVTGRLGETSGSNRA